MCLQMLGISDGDLEEWMEEVHCGECRITNKVIMSGLIARLEASERKNKADDAYDDFYCIHTAEDQCRCGIVQQELLKEVYDSDKAWRKAAGKE